MEVVTRKLDTIAQMLENYVRRTYTTCESFARFSREIVRTLARTALELKKFVDSLVGLLAQVEKRQNPSAAITCVVMMKAVPSEKMKNRLGSDSPSEKISRKSTTPPMRIKRHDSPEEV